METSRDCAAEILKFPLFKDLDKDPTALRHLAKLMRHDVFNVRDFIIDEKVSDSRMYFLLSGQVEINKIDEKGQIAVIGRTDARSNPYFGESVLLGHFNRSANVIAYSQCECLTLLAKDFETFMESHPYVVAGIYRQMAKILFDRLAKANKDVAIASLSSKK